MNTYLNEYESWEALKIWWKKYNAVLIVSFSLILLALSVYKYWNWHLEKRSVQASNSYEHMMLAAANHQANKIIIVVFFLFLRLRYSTCTIKIIILNSF